MNTKPLSELINSKETFLLGIARVSDISQVEALPAQKKRIIAYAENVGIPYHYVQFNESAYKGPRQEFNELVIDTVDKARSKVIIVFDKIDRYTRDSSGPEKTYLNKKLREGAIELHFPSDNLFLSKDSPAADLFRMDIGVALAGYYSSAIRDNVRRRFDQKLADGEWPGKAPIGYLNYIKEYDRKGEPIKDIKVDEDRAELIKRGFEMRATGMSYAAIAKQLTKAGLTTVRTHNPLAKSHVEHFLKNPFYCGEMRYEGKLYPHHYEPLISRFLWEQVQIVDEKRATKATKYLSKQFLYRDAITCETCGYTVSSDGPKKGGNIYLKCTEYGGKHGATRVNEKLINAQVANILESLKVPEIEIKNIADALKKEIDKQRSEHHKYVDRLRKEYDHIEDEIKQMFKDRDQFRVKPELFEQIINEYTAQQQDILDQLKDHKEGDKRTIVNATRILELASKASEIFLSESSKLDHKRSIVNLVLSNLRLEGDKLLFNLKEPFDSIAECAENDTWLPLHTSISNLSLEYQVDGSYLKDLAKRLGMKPPALLSL